MIIFRKSTNKNSFGLRGYWSHDKDTLSIWSFATSSELEKGANVNPHDYELPRREIQFKTSKEFNTFLM